jgi:hypothetical protein
MTPRPGMAPSRAQGTAVPRMGIGAYSETPSEVTVLAIESPVGTTHWWPGRR